MAITKMQVTKSQEELVLNNSPDYKSLIKYKIRQPFFPSIYLLKLSHIS